MAWSSVERKTRISVFIQNENKKRRKRVEKKCHIAWYNSFIKVLKILNILLMIYSLNKPDGACKSDFTVPNTNEFKNQILAYSDLLISISLVGGKS